MGSRPVSEAPEVVAALDAIEAEAAELCGQRNVITARLVAVIRRMDADGLWVSSAARSLEHW